jgi:hypothetical protein
MRRFFNQLEVVVTTKVMPVLQWFFELPNDVKNAKHAMDVTAGRDRVDFRLARTALANNLWVARKFCGKPW